MRLNQSDRLLLLIVPWCMLLQIVSGLTYTCRLENVPQFKQQFCVFNNIQYDMKTTDIDFLEPEGTSGSTSILFKNSTMDQIPRQFLNKFGANLEVLHVEKCGLKSVVITSKMAQLFASDNYITKVIVHQTPQNTPLTRLYLAMNRLTDITNITRNLVNLEVLDLSRNERISKDSTITLSAFNSMEKLTDLLLADVGALYINYDDSLNLPSLILLDLTMNSLIPSDLRVTYFSTLPKLETLRLQHNNMAEIDYTDFKDMKSLKEIYLDGNAFHCDYLSRMIAYLKERNIMIKAGTQAETCSPGFSILGGMCCQGFTMPPRPSPAQPTPPSRPSPAQPPSAPVTPVTPNPTETTKPTKVDKDDKGGASQVQYNNLLFATVCAVVLAKLS